MDHPSSANDNSNNNNNSDSNIPFSSNLGSDVFGSQFDVPATNIPIPSTNHLSSQMDSFK